MDDDFVIIAAAAVLMAAVCLKRRRKVRAYWVNDYLRGRQFRGRYNDVRTIFVYKKITFILFVHHYNM